MARQLIIELVGKADKFKKALDDGEKATKSFGDKVEGAGKKMTGFVSVPIVGFLAAGTKAAIDDAAAQDHLARTIGNTVGNSKKLVEQAEAYVSAAQKVSTFTDDELRPAFETLITTTNSVEDAQKLMNVAMDVAAGKGIDLETAAKAVAKAQEGQFAAVNKLVPGLINMNDKTLTADDAVRKLAATFTGQAQGATETTAGKMKMFQRDVGELAEKLGTSLLPAVTTLADFLTNTLIPTLDKVSGDNGALVLLGVAAIGPVTNGVNTLRNAVVLLSGSLWTLIGQLATLAASPVGLFVISLALALKDVRDRMREIKSEGFNFGNVAKGVPGSGLSLIGGLLENIPGFANGGVVGGAVGQAQLAMVHGGERIVPNRGGRNGGDGGDTFNITVEGSVIQERDLGRTIADALRNNALIGVG